MLREKVKALFMESESLYYSDVARLLDLDLRTAVREVNALKREGFIEFKDVDD